METKKDSNRNDGADSLPMGQDVGSKKGQPKEGATNAVAVSAQVTKPLENDILLGRGRGTHSHPGNIRMRETLSRYKKQYIEAKRGMKHGIIMQAFHEVIQDGDRFLRRIEEEDHWVIVDKETAIMKIGHCLRSNKQTQQLQVKSEVNLPIVSSSDEGANWQSQSGTLHEPSTDIFSIPRPSLRNHYDPPSSLSLGSLTQRLMWETMQPQYAIEQLSLPWLSSLPPPNIFALAEFIRAPSRVRVPSSVDAMELALRIDVLRELQQDQTRGTRGQRSY